MLNLPTDNLYKFLAISGLVIVMFSIYYPFQKDHELKFLLIDIDSEIKLKELQITYLETKSGLLKQELDKIEKMLNENDQIPDKELHRTKMQTMYDDFYKSVLELHKSNINIIKDTEKSQLLNKELEVYKIIGIVSLVLGIIVMVGGFWVWYIKVQRPADNQLQQVKETQEKDTKSKELIHR